MATILVTGGTGTLGRPLVTRLRSDGHEVRVLSRRGPEHPVDLSVGGAALDTALAGVDTVVHCASSPRGGDETAARNLLTAVRRAGVGHVVYISIVGVDRVPFSYYRTKFAVERMIEESGVGWTILRTTQFHDLVAQVLNALSKSPVMPIPSAISDQPIEVTEVSLRLAELAAGEPQGRVLPFEIDPAQLEAGFKKLRGELVHWTNKGRYTKVRFKFRGKQLLPDLPLAAVAAAEGIVAEAAAAAEAEGVTPDSPEPVAAVAEPTGPEAAVVEEAAASVAVEGVVETSVVPLRPGDVMELGITTLGIARQRVVGPR